MDLTAHEENCLSFSLLKPNKEPLPLSQFEGRVILLVNTASLCGFTKQYSELETLYENYKDKGLVIIAVPSNDFGNQEPLSDTEIPAFCQKNYGVSFLVTAKESVKGPHAHPVYQWAHKILGYWAAPKWNFHKYLINRQGKLIDYFLPTTTPDNPRLIKAIEKALSAKN